MVSKNYFLLIKTADAEKRAWRNLAAERRAAVFPVLELTRGKKNRGAGKDQNGKDLTAEQLHNTPNIYGFERNYLSAFELMADSENFFVDLTREPSLSCKEIEDIGLSTNGYERWTKFVLAAKADNEGILPTLIVNPSDDETEQQYVANLRKQFDTFAKNFKGISYRASVLEDDGFLYDLIALKDNIAAYEANGGAFFIFLDHEYIRPTNGLVHAKRTSQIISSILNETPNAKVVSFATSFPKSVTDIGDEEHGIFRVEEMYLFEELIKVHENTLYGDYGSINPIRNDEVIITQGWRPRIDFVSRHEFMQVYYFREKRDVIGTETVMVKGKAKKKNIPAPYSGHYTSVAHDVCSFAPFYENLSPSWGNDEVRSAANGKVPSNSPSHWISVRMELHVIQVLKQLALDPL